MKPSTRSAYQAFRAAQEERRRRLHDHTAADALVAARAELERQMDVVLGRVPYEVRRVSELRSRRGDGKVHLAVKQPVRIGTFRPEKGMTLCGAPPGRGAPERPVTCDACLRTLDQHVDLEEDPPAFL